MDDTAITDDTDDYGGFDGYVPTTKDPGTLFFILTSGYIIFSILVLGLLVHFGRKFKKYRKARKARKALSKSPEETLKNVKNSRSTKSLDGTVTTLDESLLGSHEISGRGVASETLSKEIITTHSDSSLSSTSQGNSSGIPVGGDGFLIDLEVET